MLREKLDHFMGKIYLNLSDLITGNSVSRNLDFLMISQYWNRKQIEMFQHQKLKKLLNYAFNNIEYYRELSLENKINSEDFTCIGDLKYLPVLTKSDIRTIGEDKFRTKNINNRRYIWSSSSGSTGEPFFYLNTKDAYSVNIASNIRGWLWMGYKLGDKYIKLSQNPRESKIKRLQDYFSNNLYLSTNPLIEENYKIILTKIEKYKPLFIRCYPDPLLQIARHKAKHPVYKYTPLAINTTGNTLFNEMRNEIEQNFRCKIFDSYSCEGNATAFECPTHKCYHSTEEYGISEILNDSRKRIKEGVGKLISTDLWNFAQPFIRYDTQDLVETSYEKCICGRELLKINRIIGRDNDIIVNNEGRIFIVHNFTGFFSSDTSKLKRSIMQFQIVKKRNNAIVFNLVVNSNYDEEVENYIRNFWEKELKCTIIINVCDKIDMQVNNKRRFIVNE